MLPLIFVAAFLAWLAKGNVLGQILPGGSPIGNSFGISNRNATFDYIIVGGGLAGSVMAARLMQHPNITVAVVEAGTFYEITNGNWSQVPYWSEEGAGSDLANNLPGVDWNLLTEPQVSGKRIHYAQGRNLGGSSGRNQMLYHRGTKGFYQSWADHVQDQSYTWQNMTRYLERSMTFTPPRMDIENDNKTISYDPSVFLTYSNSSNPLQVSYPSYLQQLSAYGPGAFDQIGLSEQAGFSSGILHGYGTWTQTIDPKLGLRSSAESTFLNQVLGCERLKAYVNTLAQNIIFDSNNTATGVNVTSIGISPNDAQYFTLTARKEVILSAGAWHSPQILMLSGIGPAATLDKFGIPIISALNGVGQNIWDTTNIGGVVYPINDTLTTFTSFQNNNTLMHQAQRQLQENGTGPLTNIGTDFVAWYKIPADIASTLSEATQQHLSTLPADWPELEFSIASTSRSLEISSSSSPVGSINCLMVGTAGRGNMTIKSASIFDRPVINPNWLSDPRDQEVAVAAFKLARKAWGGVPGHIKIGDEMFPGSNVTTDQDLLSAIKGNIAAIHHASASCAMGKIGAPATVVDSEGKVVGVQRLRVVDSSTFPFTNPGHTQGTTYAHAEKMVELVLRSLSHQEVKG